ncbi:MAG: hypothetical protein R3C32_14675 [Chloroflexota bacterium]
MTSGSCARPRRVPARLPRRLDLRDLLEIGFYQGKSSAYIGAILEDRGGPGHLLTIDRGDRARNPPASTSCWEPSN